MEIGTWPLATTVVAPHVAGIAAQRCPARQPPEQGRPWPDLPFQSRRGTLDDLLALLPEFARPSSVQSGNLVSVSCQEPMFEVGILQAAFGWHNKPQADCHNNSLVQA